MIIPHFFRVNQEGVRDYFVVEISVTNYTEISTEWMIDHLLPEGDVYQPCVDITLESHIFPSERDALEFIGEWWSSRPEKLAALKNKFDLKASPWARYIEAEIESLKL